MEIAEVLRGTNSMSQTIRLPYGSAEIKVDIPLRDLIAVVKAGDIFFIPKNPIHSTKSTMKNGTLEIYFVYAGAPSLEKSGYKLVNGKQSI